MPRKTSAETLEGFVRQQDATTLASVLLELAEEHVAVRDRLARLQLSSQPKALAAGFRKVLVRISSVAEGPRGCVAGQAESTAFQIAGAAWLDGATDADELFLANAMEQFDAGSS